MAKYPMDPCIQCQNSMFEVEQPPTIRANSNHAPTNWQHLLITKSEFKLILIQTNYLNLTCAQLLIWVNIFVFICWAFNPTATNNVQIGHKTNLKK